MTAPVRIVFLGGLGEIGRNCFCLEVDGRIVVVDCGLMFPDADMPGVDLVLPDFTYLRANADRVEGIVLTHGHEDHVGGLSYLLRDVQAPIYGSALSLGFARKRIEEAGLISQTELMPVTDGEVRTIGPVEAEFVPVTHSVPHAFAVAYTTPVGTILHTGDFKLDLTPVDGRTHRPPAPRRDRARRREAPPLGLDQRRAAGLHAVGVDRGPGDPRAAPRPPRPPLRRRLVRLAPAPRRAGRATRPSPPGARWRSSGGRWCTTPRSPARWACSTCRSTASSTSRRRSDTRRARCA